MSFWRSSTNEQAVYIPSVVGALRLHGPFCAHLWHLHGLSTAAIHCPGYAANVWPQNHRICGAEELRGSVCGPFFLARRAQYLCVRCGYRGSAATISAWLGDVAESSTIAGTDAVPSHLLFAIAGRHGLCSHGVRAHVS